jgi:hypothetical protein
MPSLQAEPLARAAAARAVAAMVIALLALVALVALVGSMVAVVAPAAARHRHPAMAAMVLKGQLLYPMWPRLPLRRAHSDR